MIVHSIVDTGPIVALHLANDHHHDWAVGAFASLSEDGMVTCEAVLTESCFLMSRWPAAIDALFRRVFDGGLKIVSMESDTVAVHAVMRKYRSVPASYADGCIVRLSERFPRATIVTVDSDFRIYRRNGRQAIPLIAPFVKAP